MPAGVRVEGLAEFKRDLKRAGEDTKTVTAVIKKAGAPVLAKAVAYAPKGDEARGDKHPGALAASGRILAGGNKGRVVFPKPYGPGAEFGSHGRWKGFDRWGSPPRYGYRALNESADEIAQIIEAGLAEIVFVYGWFH